MSVFRLCRFIPHVITCQSTADQQFNYKTLTKHRILFTGVWILFAAALIVFPGFEVRGFWTKHECRRQNGRNPFRFAGGLWGLCGIEAVCALCSVVILLKRGTTRTPPDKPGEEEPQQEEAFHLPQRTWKALVGLSCRGIFGLTGFSLRRRGCAAHGRESELFQESDLCINTHALTVRNAPH